MPVHYAPEYRESRAPIGAKATLYAQSLTFEAQPILVLRDTILDEWITDFLTAQVVHKWKDEKE